MESEGPTRPGTVRTGGRSARVRAAILAAALAELTEHGYAGVSAASVADRAGVNRTTVHRRWPDRAELVADALRESPEAATPIPDTGSFYDDIEQLLQGIAKTLDKPANRRLIRSLVADAARSPDIDRVNRDVFLRRFAQGAAVVQSGIVRDDIPPMTIFNTFVGTLYLRVLITDEPLDKPFLEDVITLGLRATAPAPN